MAENLPPPQPRDVVEEEEEEEEEDSTKWYMCEVCGEMEPWEAIEAQDCECLWCVPCIEKAFTVAASSGEMPRCCEPFDIERLLQIVSNDVREMVSKRIGEIRDPRRVYCHIKTCSAYIERDDRIGVFGHCTKCGKNTCTVCAMEYHSGVPCKPNEELEKVKKLAREEGWQTCPGEDCKRPSERIDGCEHMVCPYCSTNFCYECGKAWNDPTHGEECG